MVHDFGRDFWEVAVRAAIAFEMLWTRKTTSVLFIRYGTFRACYRKPTGKGFLKSFVLCYRLGTYILLPLKCAWTSVSVLKQATVPLQILYA